MEAPNDQNISPTIERVKAEQFLASSLIKHPLMHYSLDVEGLKREGFDLAKRGTGLASRAVEPIGVSLVDPKLNGGYNNPFEVDQKIEALKDRSPKAGRVEVAADIRRQLVFKTLEDLWESPFYREALKRFGCKYDHGSVVLGTGDFVKDQKAKPTELVPHEDLKRVLTEILKAEGYDAIVIEELAEVLILDPKKLRIIED